MQAKTIKKRHICIFLHYAFIDPNNIFQYCIFDGWSHVIEVSDVTCLLFVMHLEYDIVTDVFKS